MPSIEFQAMQSYILSVMQALNESYPDHQHERTRISSDVPCIHPGENPSAEDKTAEYGGEERLIEDNNITNAASNDVFQFEQIQHKEILLHEESHTKLQSYSEIDVESTSATDNIHVNREPYQDKQQGLLFNCLHYTLCYRIAFVISSTRFQI